MKNGLRWRLWLLCKTVAAFGCIGDILSKTVAGCILKTVAESWACDHVLKILSETVAILETVATLSSGALKWPCWKVSRKVLSKTEAAFETDCGCIFETAAMLELGETVTILETVLCSKSLEKSLKQDCGFKKSPACGHVWARLWPFSRLLPCSKSLKKETVDACSRLWPCLKILEWDCGHS